MWSFILSLISGPLLNGLVQAYREKLKAAGQTDTLAVNLAVQDLQAQIEARKAAASVATTPVGAWVQAAFALIVILFMSWAILYDKIVCKWIHFPEDVKRVCTTDPITGDMATWVSLIIGFYFGGAIVSNVTNSVINAFIRMRKL